MEFILFFLFFCGCGGGEFVYFVPFHFFSTAREFPLVTQNTPVGTNASWHGTRIRGHTSRFVTVSFFFFSANQPSSAGYIWGTNNKIKKKRNGIKENITGGGNICRPPFPIQSNENCWMCRPSPAYHVATYRFSFTTDEVFQSADIPAATPSRRPHPSKKETKIYYSGRRTEFFPPPAFFFLPWKCPEHVTRK